jgi:hypothetical protein
LARPGEGGRKTRVSAGLGKPPNFFKVEISIIYFKNKNVKNTKT